MNVLIAHGHGHRLLNNSILESAPVSDTKRGGGLSILDADWQQRSAEEMDLSGGDLELIRSQLQLLGHVFFAGERRLPIREEKKDETPDPNTPRG